MAKAERERRNQAKHLDRTREQIEKLNAEEELKAVMDNEHEGMNMIDDPIRRTMERNFFALYTILKAKIIHLKNFDPWKERIRIYCLFMGKCWVEYVTRLIGALPEEQRQQLQEQRQQQQGRTRTLMRTIVRNVANTVALVRYRALGRRDLQVRELTGVQHHTEELVEEDDDQAVRFHYLGLSRVHYTHFKRLTFKLTSIGYNCVDEQTALNVNATLTALSRELDGKPNMTRLSIVRNKLISLMKQTEKHVREYYGQRLNSELLVDTSVKSMFEKRDFEHLQFDFGPMAEIELRIVDEIRDFSELTRRAHLVDREDFDLRTRSGKVGRYAGLLRTFIGPATPEQLNAVEDGNDQAKAEVRKTMSGRVNPLEPYKEGLVVRDTPPSVNELIEVATE